jgi:hypothetical protein
VVVCEMLSRVDYGVLLRDFGRVHEYPVMESLYV